MAWVLNFTFAFSSKKGQRNSLNESKTDTDGTDVLLHFEC